MDYIKRPDYLSKLRKWKDHHIIKVLTGVRRAGKSTLLSLFRSELLKDGVDDVGIRNYLLGARQFDRGHVLENVVYLELLRRHGEVFIGRNGTKEIDFIARDAGDMTYYQVAETLAGDEVREREFNALRTVRDHHPKMILTLDPVPPSNDGGIRTVNALDFLLGKR